MRLIKLFIITLVIASTFYIMGDALRLFCWTAPNGTIWCQEV